MATETRPPIDPNSPSGRERGGIKVIPRPDGAIGPTTDEAAEINRGALAPGPTRSFVEALSRNWAVRLGIGTVAGYAAYQNVPAFHEPFNFEKFKTDALGTTFRLIAEKGPAVQERVDELMGKSVPVTNSFDSGVEKQKIKAGTNTVPVSEDELPTLFEKASKTDGVEILFPVKLSPQAIVNYEATNDQFAPIVEGKPEDLRLIIPQKGTEIIVPVENAQLYLGEPLAISWTESYFTGIRLKWTGKDGKIYVMGLGWGSPDVRAVKLMEISKDAPIVQGGKDYWKNIVNSQGLPLTGGMSILTTEFDYAKVGMNVTEVSRDGSQRKLVPFSFMTETDEDGNQKLVYMPTRVIQSHVSTILP